MGKDKGVDDTATSRAPRGLPLQHGEDVVLVATPSRIANLHRYVFTLGAYGIWRKRDTAVITTRRLLISRGVFRREEHSITISDIDSVRYARRFLNSYAVVTIGGRARRRTEELGPMSARTARRVVGELLSRR
jgi:hypothetical protein